MNILQEWPSNKFVYVVAELFFYTNNECNVSQSFLQAYRVQLSISDASDSASAFDCQITTLNNIRAAEVAQIQGGDNHPGYVIPGAGEASAKPSHGLICDASEETNGGVSVGIVEGSDTDIRVPTAETALGGSTTEKEPPKEDVLEGKKPHIA
ncbi:Uncharacterized protein Rs2_29730 [Raphanus sativus]|nr:Uncharacterized protein Rs2_29730 [Raphanus sativus]